MLSQMAAMHALCALPAVRREAGSTATAYFIAPKRLSNEFDETIGAEPAT